jgi:uncharacterized protein YgbK (DUF1537 family)
MGIRFGAIADDFTGGTDLAGMLHEGGLRTVQFFGLPDRAMVRDAAEEAQALVISLKTRSVPAGEACGWALRALEALEAAEPAQVQFKYCSTFDSTAEGNIGPVTGALMQAMGERFTVAVPALPVNGRTQAHGHLFVNGRLLAESPMREHPLNPMTDSDLVRHLQRQTERRVGLVALPAVLRGAEAIREEMERLRGEGVEIALVDAVREEDLREITQACEGLRLITGGSGFGRWVGGGSGAVFGRNVRASKGAALVLAGSCSAATREQLAVWEASGGRVMRARTAAEVRARGAEARECLERGEAVGVASSAGAEERTGEDPVAFERAFAALAAEAVGEWGVERLIVAGGETSGAVVEAVGIRSGRIAGILAPGVPAMESLHPAGLWFALKSGNFGGPDFFVRALGAESGEG